MKGEKDAILNYSKRNDCYLCGCEVSGHLNVLIPRVSVFHMSSRVERTAAEKY